MRVTLPVCLEMRLRSAAWLDRGCDLRHVGGEVDLSRWSLPPLQFLALLCKIDITAILHGCVLQ